MGKSGRPAQLPPGSRHLLARGDPAAIPKIASVRGSSIRHPKIPWKLSPQMQKPIAPAAAQPAVLGSAQRSPRALFLPGCGVTPPKKNPKRAGLDLPRETKPSLGWGEVGVRVQPATGDPDVLQEHLA